MAEPDPELPRAVALAWGVAANPQRGPKRELSIERIVDAAVEIADARGLGAVSMASVAAALGFTPMSLYRYVSAKEDLVQLMQEAGIGTPPETVRDAPDWRSAMVEYAAAQDEVYERHPWILEIPISGIPLTPNNLAWMDAALDALAPTGLSYDERTAATLAILAQVRWRGTVLKGYAATALAEGADPADLDRAAERILSELVTPEEFPSVHAALREGVFGPDAPGDPFAFGLARLLDGIAAALVDRPAPSARRVDPQDAVAERDPKVREAAKARREAEKALREARKREREALSRAKERLGRG